MIYENASFITILTNAICCLGQHNRPGFRICTLDSRLCLAKLIVTILDAHQSKNEEEFVDFITSASTVNARFNGIDASSNWLEEMFNPEIYRLNGAGGLRSWLPLKFFSNTPLKFGRVPHSTFDWFGKVHIMEH